MLFPKYILKNLLWPSCLSIIIISLILLMNNIYKFIPFFTGSGINFKIILQMIIFSLPTILTFTIPLGLMIGIYSGINYLSLNSEIIAIRSSGNSLFILFKPVLMLAGIGTMIVIINTLILNPAGSTALEKIKFNLIKKQTKIKILPRTINHFGNHLIYITKKQNQEIYGVFIANWKKPNISTVIEAKQGTIKFQKKQQNILLLLKNGKIYLPDEQSKLRRIILFEQFSYPLELPNINSQNLPSRFSRQNYYSETNKRDFEMTVSELRKNLLLTKDNKEKNELITEIHSRFVIPLSCLVLALFALTIGINNPRNPDRLALLKLLLIIISYYTFYTQTFILSDNGKIHYSLIYLPPLIAILISLFFFYKKNYDFSNFREMLPKKLQYYLVKLKS